MVEDLPNQAVVLAVHHPVLTLSAHISSKCLFERVSYYFHRCRLWQWFSTVDSDRSGAITAPELERALINGDWTRES